MMPVSDGYKPRWPHGLQANGSKKIAVARRILDDRVA
jgi:hypothetical protein